LVKGRREMGLKSYIGRRRMGFQGREKEMVKFDDSGRHWEATGRHN
jgi:hypothetical protein